MSNIVRDKMQKTRSNALRVRPNIRSAGSPDMRGLIELAKKDGRRFVEITGQLVTEGKLRWDDPIIDMRALFDATIDIPTEVEIEVAGLGASSRRTLTTSAFPIIAGQLTAELLERQDDEAETIWQELVTVRDTNKETTHLIRIINQDPSHVGGKRRVEGDPYPLMASGEERMQVDTLDDGRRVAINQKVIETNDKAGFIEQVGGLREWANNRRDVVALHRVWDLYGSGTSPAAPYVYRPDGTGTALYTTSTTAHRRAKSGTRITDRPLVDGQSLQAAINVLANMRDENGIRVGGLTELDLVVPHALASVADVIVLSERTPGVVEAYNPYGPRGRYRIRVITSPKIDDFTTTDWLLGRRINRQFVMVTRINMEFVSMPGSMTDFLRTRLAFEARIADEFEVGARDHNRVVQALATTTAPTGPTLGS